MTRELRNFAKNRIEYLIKISPFVFDEPDREALEMAIQALSQEPTKREIEREYLFQSLCEDFKKLQAENDDLRKRLEQEPCTDAVSRASVIKFEGTNMACMGGDEIMKEFENNTQEPCQKDCRLCKEFDKCVNGRKGHKNGTSIGYSVGECKDFEPCDDAISREAFIKRYDEWMYSEYGKHCEKDALAIRVANSLPSVTPKSGHFIDGVHAMGYREGYKDAQKQKSGKWNEYYTSQKGNDVFNCKECGHTFVVTQGKDNMNYCPNCGVKMVEP